MTSSPIHHALGLHMHQPPGNLALLAEANPFEAEQIIRCYERAARYAHRYPQEGRLHVGFSGVLLEQLRDPAIVDRYRHLVDIPALLESYRTAPNVELIGMGYYHPIFPLIPTEDWADQLTAGRQILEDTFGRAPSGFWPPEMAFTMEMVPALVAAGYRYVVVDGVHVQPEEGAHDIYRPYLACHEGHCITVVPRDRDVSNAQESGLNPAWFANEVRHKVAGSPHPHEPRLVTTWSDGENGGWFRQLHEEAGFFGHFFAPYMEHVRYGDYPTVPVLLSAYLDDHPAVSRAQVRTGAWNVGSTSGYDFSQWAGSGSQRHAVETLVGVSRRYHELAAQAGRLPPAAHRLLQQARALVLEAETSCFLFWGDAWIPQLYERTRPAEALLAEVADAARSAPTGSTPAASGPAVSVPAVSVPAASVPAASVPAGATTATFAATAEPVAAASEGQTAGPAGEPAPASRAEPAMATAAEPAGPPAPEAPLAPASSTAPAQRERPRRRSKTRPRPPARPSSTRARRR